MTFWAAVLGALPWLVAAVVCALAVVFSVQLTGAIVAFLLWLFDGAPVRETYRVAVDSLRERRRRP